MFEVLAEKGVKVSGLFEAISNAWSEIVFAVGNVRFFDIVDIIVVAYVVYKCIELFRETRSGQLFKGILALLVLYVFAKWFDMVSINWILVKVFEYGIIALAVIFQPEIRRALEKVGRSNLGKLGRGQSFEDSQSETLLAIDAVCKSCGTLQEQKTGALIVFERSSLLGEIIDTGTVVDAKTSPQLLCNIFYTKSPLHDGAVVLREGRVAAAGCILPLSSNENIASQLGTRHRAAMGMSENSDAVVVVVSEETGTISFAEKGVLKRNLTPITLREILKAKLLPDSQSDTGKTFMDVFNKTKEKFKVSLKKGAKENDESVTENNENTDTQD